MCCLRGSAAECRTLGVFFAFSDLIQLKSDWLRDKELQEGWAYRKKVKNGKLRFGIHVNIFFLNGHAANDDWWVRQMAAWVTTLLATETCLDNLAIQENDALLNRMCPGDVCINGGVGRVPPSALPARFWSVWNCRIRQSG